MNKQISVLVVVCSLLIIFTNCGNSKNDSFQPQDPITSSTNDSLRLKDSLKPESNNSIKLELLNNEKLPNSLKIQGNVLDYKVWKDRNGINYAVITLTDIVQNDKSEYTNTIFGYHFVQKPDKTYQLKRKIQDFFTCEWEDCKEGLSLHKDSFTITDLDTNGYGEIAFIYQFYCSMDLSWANAKLMLLENGEKYPIRGNTFVEDYGEIEGNGLKIIGKEFDSASKEFKEYASKLWDKFCRIK
ncbi:MAG: hypothetical protein COA88_14045 [Kordia sp.]|nr:MAG: hypothetical protein COA88_14045 [Kordia sp.]